jgi:hypothetical protein
VAGYVSVTGTQYSPVFVFGDESLQQYQRRSAQRLDIILEQIDLGALANLGYAKVTWLPDKIARVRYTVMEGILEPIILVKIDFQEEERNRQTREDLEELPDVEEVEEEIYSPYLWVGIASFNHVLTKENTDNVNCLFWGYPVDSRLYALEPRFEAADGETLFGFRNSAESLPGTLFAGGQVWVNRIEGAFPDTGASEQTSFQVNSGQDWIFNQFMLDQGTFQDSDWRLSSKGVVAAAINSGMIATEHMDTLVTAPPEAYGTAEYPDAILGESTPIDPGYWRRSIIVDPGGHEFPEGLFSQTINVIDDLGTAINSATYAGGTIPCDVLPGEYEISAFAQSFSCECTEARLHIRMVLGDTGGAVTVVDFFPEGPGSTPTESRHDFIRNLVLGGQPGSSEKCQEITNNIFGGNDGGVGWWPLSLYVNVEIGSFRLDTGSRLQPHFDFECPIPPKFGPDHPNCAISCTGDAVESPANFLDYGSAFFNTTYVIDGNLDEPFALDLRGSVLWHMARVVQVRSNTGFICFVKLLGNDGAAGGGCSPCQAFSYGHTLRAIGVDPAIPLGTNLALLPGQGRVPYTVGELVTVIGFTDPFGTPCGVLGGDWRLIVTRPHGAGQDFTHISWKELRCPGFEKVDAFFEKIELALANRVSCLNGLPTHAAPLPTECSCINGQLRCVQ